MNKTIEGNTQNQGVDETSKYTLSRQNVKALSVLFVITAFAGVLSWYSNVTSFIHNPTVESFGYDLIFLLVAAQSFRIGGPITPVLDVPYQGVSLPHLTTGFFPYPYTPPSIYVWVPLTYLSFEQACVIWSAISVAALLLSIFLVTKILYRYGIRLSKLETVLIYAAVFLFEPVVHNLTAININLLILLLITSFYYLFFVQKRASSAGIVLGIAFLLKVWPLIFVFLDILHKSKKMLVATVATIATVGIASWYLQGTSAWLGWLEAFRSWDSAALFASESKAIILSPTFWDVNVSVTRAIMKVIVLFDLNASTAQLMLNVATVVFIGGVFLYLFRLSKYNIDPTKLKEWEVLSFTLLLVSILFISNVIWSYYASWLVLSFALIVFVIPLSSIEKTLLMLSIALFSTRLVIVYLCWQIGGLAKTLVYVFDPQTIAYVLLVTLIIYVVRNRTKSGCWTLPLQSQKSLSIA